jgi:hypothetical protein
MMLRKTPIIGLFGLVACGGSGGGEYDAIATGMSSLMADPQAGESKTFSDLTIAARGQAPLGLTLSGDKWVGLRDQLELSFEVSCTASPCDGSADLKVDWKGKVEEEKYKLEIERKGDWKSRVLDDERLRVEGTATLKMKSDFKDSAEDLRHKYDFESTSTYDVIVRSSDGAILSGTAKIDLHAKEKAEDGSETIKSDLKMKLDVTFEESGADLVFESKTKYRLKLDSGEVQLSE